MQSVQREITEEKHITNYNKAVQNINTMFHQTVNFDNVVDRKSTLCLELFNNQSIGYHFFT